MKTLDINECAEFFKIDPTTATKMAARGEIPGAKIGRAWVFLQDDLVEYLRQQVRIQSRLKETEAKVDDQIEASKSRNPVMALATLPHRRNKKPDNKLYHPDFPKQD
jgi:hypothetical protein